MVSMDQAQHELTFEESLKEVMQTLPPVIRDYLAQGKYTAAAQGLMSKYGLRINQGGVLERELMLLMMGVEDPDEFMATLKSEAMLPEDIVRQIMVDLNQNIFMPLREEMMKSGTGNEPQVAPPSPRVAEGTAWGSAPLPPQSTIIPANPSMPVRDDEFNLMKRVAPVRPAAPAAPRPPMPAHIAPLPPKTILPPRSVTAPAAAGTSLKDVLAAVTKVSAPALPRAPQGAMTDASKLLEDREEPHIEFHQAPPPEV